MNFFRNLKWQSLLSSLLYIAAGVLLILKPDVSPDVICYALTGVLFLVGLFSILRYFSYDISERFFRNDLTNGLLISTLAFAVLLYRKDILNLIPLALAIFVLLSAYSKLQDIVDARVMDKGNSAIYLVLILVNIIAGVLIIVGAKKFASFLYIFIGCSLVYSGLTDFISGIYLSLSRSSYLKAAAKASAAGAVTGTAFIDVSSPEADPVPQQEEPVVTQAEMPSQEVIEEPAAQDTAEESEPSQNDQE